jgi:hypothetical protein
MPAMNEIVAPPALMHQAHGLVSDANRPQTSGNAWENGVTFTPQGCASLFGFTWGCPAELKSEFQDCVAPAEFVPILLETSLKWSALDMGADPLSRLKDTIEYGTSAALERILCMGVSDDVGAITVNTLSQTLSTAAIEGRIIGTDTHYDLQTLVAAPAADTGVDSRNLGTLEAKLLDASDHVGSAGTILMSPVDAAGIYDLLTERDGKLYTKLTGSQVIIGNFVPGVIYGVVGQVDLYLSDVIVNETVDRSTNEWIGQAERLAIVAFNTCAVFGQTMAGPPN